MSLGLFAAVVIELERRSPERVSVDELATYAAVSADAVQSVLVDIHQQGHCVLFRGWPITTVDGAQWLEHPACA
ncbi:MAG: hypothetical protein RL375_3395 [Pseudomonadota bacterium]|jgi:predicted Rossmann fold nucleotide-binding protein DprA/Smf involved in DNA uptake